MLVKDQMTPNPQYVTPDVTLAAAMEIMGAESVRELPVVENGRLVGILSDRDLRRHWGHLGTIRVSAAMTPNVVTIESQAKIEEAARLLLDLKIGGLPVVNEVPRVLRALQNHISPRRSAHRVSHGAMLPSQARVLRRHLCKGRRIAKFRPLGL
jgi:acetoin utilization protein AcuB